MIKVISNNGEVTIECNNADADELGNVISIMLAEYQASMILAGNKKDMVYAIAQEIMGTVIRVNPSRVTEALARKAELGVLN